MKTNKNILSQAAAHTARRLRMFTGLQMLDLAETAQAQVLRNWLESAPLPRDFSRETDIQLEVALTIDLHRLTWRVSGPSADYYPVLSTYFEENQLFPPARAQYQKAVAELKPKRIGTWIELFHGNLDIGWFFPEEISIDRALAFASPSKATYQLKTWAKAFGLKSCTRLGHSLGEGERFAELHIPLPEADLDDQLEIVQQAFEVLEVEPLPPAALATIDTFGNPGLVLAVWFAEEAVSKLGVRLPQPDLDLLLRLSDVVGVNNDETLAAFQAAMGARHPEYLECQQMADGFGVELEYLPGVE